MPWLFRGSAALAAALHVLFFLVESLLFMRVHARLGIADPEPVRVLFFNQGFYNLFLAIGCLAGLALLRRRPIVGHTLVLFPCACMAGAGLVLLASDPRLAAGAAVQAGPPAAAWVAWLLMRRGAASGAPPS